MSIEHEKIFSEIFNNEHLKILFDKFNTFNNKKEMIEIEEECKKIFKDNELKRSLSLYEESVLNYYYGTILQDIIKNM